MVINALGDDVELVAQGSEILVDADSDGLFELSITAVERIEIVAANAVVSGDFSSTGLAAETIVFEGNDGPNVFDASGMISTEAVEAFGLAATIF